MRGEAGAPAPGAWQRGQLVRCPPPARVGVLTVCAVPSSRRSCWARTPGKGFLSTTTSVPAEVSPTPQPSLAPLPWTPGTTHPRAPSTYPPDPGQPGLEAAAPGRQDRGRPGWGHPEGRPGLPPRPPDALCPDSAQTPWGGSHRGRSYPLPLPLETLGPPTLPWARTRWAHPQPLQWYCLPRPRPGVGARTALLLGRWGRERRGRGARGLGKRRLNVDVGLCPEPPPCGCPNAGSLWLLGAAGPAGRRDPGAWPEVQL